MATPKSFNAASAERATNTAFRTCLKSLEQAHDVEVAELLLKISHFSRSKNEGLAPITPRQVGGDADDALAICWRPRSPPQPQSHEEPLWQDLPSPPPSTKNDDETSQNADWVVQTSTWNTGSLNAMTMGRGGTSSRSSRDTKPRFTEVEEDLQAQRSNDRSNGEPSAILPLKKHNTDRCNTVDDDMARIKAKDVSGRWNQVKTDLTSFSHTSSLSHRMVPSRFRAALVKLVRSPSFEILFAFVIATNSAFLGVRVNNRAESPGSDEPIVIKVIEYVYTLLFTTELYMRVAAEGFDVFCSWKHFHWYWLDLGVVISSWIEVGTDIFSSNDEDDGWNVSNTRMLRVVRVVRIIKIIRIARVVRFVRALRVLVLSILHTMRSVFWAFVLLVMIIYVFGLVFTQGVTDHIQSKADVPSTLRIFWGTLPRSMFTLYKTIANGISWHDCVTPLAEVDGTMVALFVIYVSFTVFAVLNVITGVFCEAAIESARQDYEMMIQQHLKEKHKFVSTIYQLFGVDPKTSTEEIFLSYGEFEEVLQDPKCKAQLEVMQLDITDAWELFKLLDTDESALIDVEEFVTGFLRLKGLAKAIDVAKLSYESKTRQKRIMTQLKKVEEKINKVSRSWLLKEA